jgi:hypothetical protein
LLAKKFLEESAFVAWFRSPDCNAHPPGVFAALYAKPQKAMGNINPSKNAHFASNSRILVHYFRFVALKKRLKVT